MEVFKLLDKSNCQECYLATCLAFAGAVFKGEKRLEECTHLSPDIIAQYAGSAQAGNDPEQMAAEAVQQMQAQIRKADLATAAQRIGATFDQDKLTLNILGKNFHVDTEGKLSSDIHIHPWIAMPVLSYILTSGGKDPNGEWVPLRELPNGKNWYRLFGQRCEKPLKRVADMYTDLFEDMIQIFNGQQIEPHYKADISLVLYPLPKVPMLICYWKPEDGLASSLNLFFDATAEENLNIEALFGLATGLVRMFEKISQRHGLDAVKPH
jgi:hypothetical protein